MTGCCPESSVWFWFNECGLGCRVRVPGHVTMLKPRAHGMPALRLCRARSGNAEVGVTQLINTVHLNKQQKW